MYIKQLYSSYALIVFRGGLRVSTEALLIFTKIRVYKSLSIQAYTIEKKKKK